MGKIRDKIFNEMRDGKNITIGLDAKLPYFVNTGHYGLNLALSGRWDGGWPGGRVNEMFGDPSCLVAGTLVTLADGALVPIETLGEKHLQKINISLITVTGDKVEARVFHKYEKQTVIEILLNTGLRLRGSVNQPVLTGRGWVRLDSLKKGDTIKIATSMPSENKQVRTNFILEKEHLGPRYKGKIPEILDEKLAAVLGYLMGDGWIATNHVGFMFNESELDLLPILCGYMKDVFGLDAHVYIRQPAKPHMYAGILIEGKQTVTCVEYYRTGLVKMFAFMRTKKIPEMILTAGNLETAVFLKWLFEADGCVFGVSNGRGRVLLKSSSIELLQGVQLLLLRFGIASQICEGLTRGGHVYGNLVIRQRESLVQYEKHINFASEKKRNKLTAVVANLSYKRESLCKPVQVKKVTICRKKETVYDVEVPGENQFIANGIACHNTGKSILMTRAGVSMQRGEITIGEDTALMPDEGVVMLHDTEGAALESFCAMQGMDTAEIIKITDAPSVEKHFSVVEEKIDIIRKISKKAPIGIILDSISQLSTVHELTEDMDKPDMSKAKVVHKAMRKYADFIFSNDIMYLMASHVTQGIGMFGPHRVVKGGSGVAFQSSIRVDLKYITRFIRNKMVTDEAGDRGEAYGVKVIAEVVKNKISAPFKFTVIDIYYDRGIDPYSGLFDYFTRQGRITSKKKKKEEADEEEKVKDVKGKKPKKKIDLDAVYLFDDKPFIRGEFDDFVIQNDVLGLGDYLPPINKTENDQAAEEEELAEVAEAPNYPPPPAPAPSPLI